MKRIRKFSLMVFVLFSVAGCDSATKILAKNYLYASPPISFLKNTIVMLYAENAGAFLSFGAELPHEVRFWAFVLLPGFFMVGLFIHVLISSKLTNYQVIAFCLIIGGGFGNLCDRVFRPGHVVDFLNIGIGPVRTGIFNLADVAIMIGFAMLLLRAVSGFVGHGRSISS